MSDDGAFVSGIVLGTLIMAGAWVAVTKYHTVNISDAELYRFCMKKNITLAECIIDREILDKQPEPTKGAKR